MSKALIWSSASAQLREERPVPKLVPLHWRSKGVDRDALEVDCDVRLSSLLLPLAVGRRRKDVLWVPRAVLIAKMVGVVIRNRVYKVMYFII